VVLLFVAQVVTAQTDTTKSGSVYFKSIRIIGNDTIIDERQMDLSPSSQGNNSFFFRFGDDSDSMSPGFEGMMPDSDSLFREFFARPFGRQGFPSDTARLELKFRFPDTDTWQGEPFRFDLPEMFATPGGTTRGGLFGFGHTPTFSIEDVAVYPENNTVKQFEISPVPGTTLLLVRASLDNKKSEYIVYDNRGNTITHEKLRRINGEFVRVLSLDKLQSGTFFVEVKNGKSAKKKRITVR
jgi:hypothetical protein